MDWLLDAQGGVWLLEVNAFPDFAQSGEEGREVVKGVWEAVVGLVVAEGVLMGKRQSEEGNKGIDGEDRDGEENGDREGEKKTWGMKKVLDIDLGRR